MADYKTMMNEAMNNAATIISKAKEETDLAALTFFAAAGGTTSFGPCAVLDAQPMPGTRSHNKEGVATGHNNPDIIKRNIPKKKGGTRSVDISTFAILAGMTKEGAALQNALAKLGTSKEAKSIVVAGKKKANNRFNYLVRSLKLAKSIHEVGRYINTQWGGKGITAFILEGKAGAPMRSPQCLILRAPGKPEKAMTIGAFASLKPWNIPAEKANAKDGPSLDDITNTAGKGTQDKDGDGIHIANHDALEDVNLGWGNYFLNEDNVKAVKGLDPAKESDREILASFGAVSEAYETLFTDKEFVSKVEKAVELQEADDDQSTVVDVEQELATGTAG